MAEICLFDHIPKAAGSTLRKILFRVYGGDRVYMITDHGTYPTRLAELQDLLDRPDPKIACVISHAGWGLAERLPQQHTYRRFTMLRDPVQRVISAYYYRIQQKGIDPDLTLADWLEGDVARTYNHQTSFLVGLQADRHFDDLEITRDLFDDELVATAERHLSQYEAVCITEEFDASVLLLRAVYGWSFSRIVSSQSANVGQLRAERGGAVSEADLARVVAATEIDRYIYGLAEERFGADLASHVGGVPGRLRQLRLANRVYGRVYPVARALARR